MEDSIKSQEPGSKPGNVDSDENEPEVTESISSSLPNESQDGESLSPIERLPQEIIWMIIEEATGESVLELRVTSSMMRSRVDGYVAANAVVDELSFNGRDSILAAYVPKRKAKLFELRLSYHKPPFASKTGFKRSFDGAPNLPNLYKINFDSLDDAEIMAKYIKECMGKRMNSVELLNYGDQRSLDFVSSIIDGIEFKNLDIDLPLFSSSAITHLLETVKTHNVQQVFLKVGTVESADPVNVLRELSSLVRAIGIWQKAPVKQPARGFLTRHLFGVSHAEWSPIIMEMFSKKIDKLFIGNLLFPDYLSITSSQELEKKLPTLDKKVWFETSCANMTAVNVYTINEHVVHVVTDDEFNVRSRSFRVKHTSRMEETFSK